MALVINIPGTSGMHILAIVMIFSLVAMPNLVNVAAMDMTTAAATLEKFNLYIALHKAEC